MKSLIRKLSNMAQPAQYSSEIPVDIYLVCVVGAGDEVEEGGQRVGGGIRDFTNLKIQDLKVSLKW